MIKYVVVSKRKCPQVIDKLKTLMAYVEDDQEIVFGRFGTNKSALRKMLCQKSSS